MAQKNKTRTPPPDAQAAPQTLRESAQHIWMAGLSAFAKAQAGGNKVFEALMKEGESLQSRTRQAARDQVDEMAEKATGTWDKLEQVFESRVAKALHTLGVPTHEDIEQLTQRVAELTAVVDQLQTAPGAGKTSSNRAAKTAGASTVVSAARAPKTASATSAKKAVSKRAKVALAAAPSQSASKPKASKKPTVTKPSTPARKPAPAAKKSAARKKAAD